MVYSPLMLPNSRKSLKKNYKEVAQIITGRYTEDEENQKALLITLKKSPGYCSTKTQWYSSHKESQGLNLILRQIDRKIENTKRIAKKEESLKQKVCSS
jgi:hypothetical protein